jgi:ADP-heptose:LPS heptosyltransferase
VRKAGSVIASSDCLIANDGGIMHLSVALKKPTVGIFGPTEPDIWFPYEGKGPYRLSTLDLDCAPCHRHYCESADCLAGLPVEKVFEDLMEVRGG